LVRGTARHMIGGKGTQVAGAASKASRNMNPSIAELRGFVKMLTDVRHPAGDVETFERACQAFRDLGRREQWKLAGRIGLPRYIVWNARNMATAVGSAFDVLKAHGLEPTRENFRLMCKKSGGKEGVRGIVVPAKARNGAGVVLYAVGPWRNQLACGIRARRAVRKLPWRLRLSMRMPPWTRPITRRWHWFVRSVFRGV
jgi:hypothetical protein